LFCAWKEVDPSFYNLWKPQVEEAKNSILNRDVEVEKVDGLIETELTLLGSTAIEDRL
jgi:magnesium-transporting ATPase (P-type)